MRLRGFFCIFTIGSFTYEDTGGYAIESIIFNGGQFTMDSNYQLQPSFILSDNLGSSRVVMDGAFKVLARNSYYPYGQIHSENIYDAQLLKVLNRFQFNGKEKQTFSYNTDFGLLDYGARMYDPVLGLWTTQDPAPISASRTVILNWECPALSASSIKSLKFRLPYLWIISQASDFLLELIQ